VYIIARRLTSMHRARFATVSQAEELLQTASVTGVDGEPSSSKSGSPRDRGVSPCSRRAHGLEWPCGDL